MDKSQTLEKCVLPQIATFKHAHFIGIGGAGMGGIAEILLDLGYHVSGSDLSNNRVTQHLQRLGAEIHIGHDAAHIRGADVVVRSSAIRDENPEIVAAKGARVPIIARAEMLAELMRFKQGIAIAGTHGKTTTTSLMSCVLVKAELDPMCLVGGHLNSVGANARMGKGNYLVAEADESDASFLYLRPMIAVVTNVDADHLSNYDDDFACLKTSFLAFLHKIPFYGVDVICIDDPVLQEMQSEITRPLLTYGFHEDADVRAVNFKQNGLTSEFEVLRVHSQPSSPPLKISLNLPGKHNVQNALAAIAVASQLNVSDEVIQTALAEFSGVGRRFQIHGDVSLDEKKVFLLDDYGHHPREIAATIEAIRGAWPGKRLVLVYQPHRYSRTHALLNDFAAVLSEVDVLLLMEVYPAGESPIPGADSLTLCNMIADNNQLQPIHVPSTEQLETLLAPQLQNDDVLLMQGAGSIGEIAVQFADKHRK